MFYFHPYMGKIPILTSIFFTWVETTNQFFNADFRSFRVLRGSSRFPQPLGWEISRRGNESISHRKGKFGTSSAEKCQKVGDMLGLPPHLVAVTTRIIPFLVGNPNLNLHL